MRRFLFFGLFFAPAAEGVHALEKLEDAAMYHRLVDDEMPENSVLLAGFFPTDGEASSFFEDFSSLAKSPDSIWEEAEMTHGTWPFYYSFDDAIAREAGCYEAEDGDKWDGSVCIILHKVRA